MVRRALWFGLAAQWVFACLAFQKHLSGGQVGSEAGGPEAGPGQPAGSQVAAVGVVPSLRPLGLLCPSEKNDKDRSVRPSSPTGLILQVGEGRGSREAGVPGQGSLGWQKGPWSQVYERPGLPSPCCPVAGHLPSVAAGPTPSPGSGWGPPLPRPPPLGPLGMDHT